MDWPVTCLRDLLIGLPRIGDSISGSEQVGKGTTPWRGDQRRAVLREPMTSLVAKGVNVFIIRELSGMGLAPNDVFAFVTFLPPFPLFYFAFVLLFHAKI
jgi:hypothetical protein